MNLFSWLRPAGAALAFLCCAAFGFPSQRVDYVLTPVLQDGGLRAVQIDLAFRGEVDGETKLRLPDEWGGEEQLWRGVQDLSVDGAELREGESASERVLVHEPNARIRVRYRVVQDWQGVPAAGRNAYRPIVQPTYFHLIGNAALITPELNNDTPVRFSARRMPRGWTLASDLQHPGLRLGHVAASVTVGGDYRIRRDGERNVRVAIRGEWGFSDEAFARQVSEIVSGQRSFWRDPSSRYLVTVTQTYSPDPGHFSVGGTGLDDAFAFFATSNVSDAPITRTLAHEGLHTWIPGRIGGMPEEAEAAHYWFSEGFTDFYTGRMLVRQGLWTPQQFAADLNEMLATYAQSPVREAPNARIVAVFWREYPVQQLPYQRGRLLATIWDARLREQGSSLDRAMLRMRERALEEEGTYATQMLPQVLDEMGLDVRPDIATYAEAGAPILLPEHVFAPCGRVVTREVAEFHRGFDVEALQPNNNVISGVDPQSPAYAAGLRNGMVLLRREAGQIGDSEQQLTYIVRDGGEERAISYFPRGARMLVVQRLELEEPLEGERRTQCLAVLGGA